MTPASRRRRQRHAAFAAFDAADELSRRWLSFSPPPFSLISPFSVLYAIFAGCHMSFAAAAFRRHAACAAMLSIFRLREPMPFIRCRYAIRRLSPLSPLPPLAFQPRR